MSIVLNDNLKIEAPKLIDERFGPHADLTAALAFITPALREMGLIFFVKDGSNLLEYWWPTTDLSNSGIALRSYQPLDADLTAIANISDGSTGFLKKTAANTWSLDTTVVTASTAAGGELEGFYPNPTLKNISVINKVLSGFNTVGGGTIVDGDSILIAFGKVQNQLNALYGGMQFIDFWNATTNSPAIPAASLSNKGNYYIVQVAGSTNIGGITDWRVGDWLVSNGSVWSKIDNTDAVVSVNGYTGAVTLTTSDIAEGTNLYYTDLRVKTYADTLYSVLGHTHTFASLTSKPTTIAGYGITDAYTTTQINSFFLGSTPITGYNKTNWDLAYGWGNHALAGYVKGTGVDQRIPYFNAVDTVTTSSRFIWNTSLNALIVNQGIAGTIGATLSGAFDGGSLQVWNGHELAVMGSTVGNSGDVATMIMRSNRGISTANGYIDIQGYYAGGTTNAPIIMQRLGGPVIIGNIAAGADTVSRLQVAGAIRQTSVTSALLKASATGVLEAASSGTDFLAPSYQYYIGTTLNALNRSSAAQTLTGVSIDGNAGTATTFSTNRTNYRLVTDGAVVGQLMWKEYGNNHTIFDASDGTAPDGTAISSVDSLYNWAPTYPTLMGWNGGQTYGLRVDTSRYAENAGLLGGYPAVVAANANTVALRDGSGYLRAVYFYDDNVAVAGSGITSIYGGTGDKYLYKFSAAAVQSFLGLGSMAYAATSSYVNRSGDTMLGSLDINTYNLTKVGQLTVYSSGSYPSIAAIRGSYFGYSSAYPVVVFGTPTVGGGSQTLAFNVDPIANPSGSYTGHGSEYMWRNVGSFITPNAANTAYNTLWSWNSVGQLNIPNAVLNGYSTTVGVFGSTIVVRDASGDGFFRYLNTSQATEAGSITAIITRQGDDYMRISSTAHFISNLGLATTSALSGYLPLTAGSSYPLTGTLYGVGASFSSTIGVTANSSATLIALYGRASDNYGFLGFYNNNGAARNAYIQGGSVYGGQLALQGDGGGNLYLDNRGFTSTTTSINLGVTNSLTISAGANPLLAQSATYTMLYSAAASIALYLGGAGDPANYYDNTAHYFRSIGGASTHVEINSNGLIVRSGRTLYMNQGDVQFVNNSGYGILSSNGSRLLVIQNGQLSVQGTLQMGAYSLGFNEGGVRSWTVTASGGTLTYNSGDGLGTIVSNLPVNINGRTVVLKQSQSDWTTAALEVYTSGSGETGIAFHRGGISAGWLSHGSYGGLRWNGSQMIMDTHFGAATTAGTLNWNDVSNTTPGGGPTLLLGTHTAGNGINAYYHSLNFEYASKNGTGNVTQYAIPYSDMSGDMWMRGRYSGVWTAWTRFLTSGNYSLYALPLSGGTISGPLTVTGAVTFNNSLNIQGANIALRVNGGSFGNSGGEYFSLGYNVGFTATSGVYNYIYSDYASMIRFQTGGLELFSSTTSGTAGNNISFTRRFRIMPYGDLYNTGGIFPGYDNASGYTEQGSYYFYGNSANQGIRTNGNLLINGDVYIGASGIGTWLTYWLNQSVRVDGTPTFADVYTNGWFRNNNSNTGLYNQANNTHFYSSANYQWDFASAATSYLQIGLRPSGHGTSAMGYIYVDTGANVGFLNSGASWALRMDNAKHLHGYGGGNFVNDITNSAGQGRFGGWYTGTGYTGPAAEIGFSGGVAVLIGYNRNTAAYTPLAMQGGGTSITLDSRAVVNTHIKVTGGYIYGQSDSSYIRIDNTIGSKIAYGDFGASVYDSGGVYLKTNDAVRLSVAYNTGLVTTHDGLQANGSGSGTTAFRWTGGGTTGYAYSDGGGSGITNNAIFSSGALVYLSGNTIQMYTGASATAIFNSNSLWMQPNRGIIDGGFYRITNPGGATYNTNLSSVTGAIKIRMPNPGSAPMMSATVKIYEYITGRAFTLTFAGHTSGGSWYNTTAYIVGDQPNDDRAINVRFGSEGGYYCVWIGETSTSWTYPQVWVTDVQIGYASYSNSWASDWAVSFETALGSISQTRTVATPSTTGGAYAPVRRDASGYIQNSYFYTSAGGAERNGSSMGYFAGFNSSDYYIRSYTPTAARIAMGLATTDNVTFNTVTATTFTGTVTNISVNYSNNSAGSYQMIWGSGTALYGTAGIYCDPLNDIIYASKFSETSDRTLKTPVQENFLLPNIHNVKAHLYTKNGVLELGYYAQEVQPYLPHAVSIGNGKHLNLTYREVFVAKISSLEDRTEQLERKVKELETELAKLKMQ